MTAQRRFSLMTGLKKITSCVCYFYIVDAKCSDLNEINALIMAIVILIAIATLLAIISGLIGCCALCIKEPVSIFIIF